MIPYYMFYADYAVCVCLSVVDESDLTVIEIVINVVFRCISWFVLLQLCLFWGI